MYPDWKKVDDFFRRHEHLFPKPKKVGNNDWAEVKRGIEEYYGPVDFWFGRCFHAAKFTEYLLEKPGVPDGWTLMCCRSFVFEPHLGATTTHWFLRAPSYVILDLSASQFKYGIDPPYMLAKRANFGNPYFGGGEKKSKRYHKVVPTKTVIEFAKAYLAEGNQSDGLQWWVNEYDGHYAEGDTYATDVQRTS